MKVTVVPAQVTTVEDRIMGSLSFSQAILLIVPIFIGAALFACLPPLMSGSAYKYVLIGGLVLFGSILAIRVRGKIIAAWLATLLRYSVRPRIYVFNKNTVAFRAEYSEQPAEVANEAEAMPSSHSPAMRLDLAETVTILTLLDAPTTSLRFETSKKGGLHVHLTENED